MEKKKILLVEDHSEIRQIGAIMLATSGYEVETARDGRETFNRLAEDGKPDLVLLDIMLPDIDGVEVCKRIKRDSATCKIPIVMLTARSDQKTKNLAEKAGADEYVVKPFKYESLLKAIGKLVH